MRWLIEWIATILWELVAGTITGYVVGWLSEYASRKIGPVWERCLLPNYQTTLSRASDLISRTITDVSNFFWERFLPSDYEDIVARSVSPIVFSTKRELYFHLCDSPVLLDGGTMSFQLDEKSGKKCYMIAAKQLSIAHGVEAQCWKWAPHSGSRFSEAAELGIVYSLSIRGKIETRMLSPGTKYAVYLVFKIAENSCGLSDPAKTSIKLVHERGVVAEKRIVYFKEQTASHVPIERNFPQERNDGWMEIEMGELFTGQGNDSQLELNLKEPQRKHKKSGLIVQGIELRPKEDNAFRLNTYLSVFKPVAESETQNIQLSDCPDTIITRSLSPLPCAPSSDPPVNLPDNSKMHLTVDEKSGIKHCMLGARGLKISTGTSENWKWTSHPSSRFSEVAEFHRAYWLSIRGEIETQKLSSRTTYAVYLVFEVGENSRGLSEFSPVKTSIRLVGAGRGVAEEKTVYWKAQTASHVPTEWQGHFPQKRTDGWMEIEIGEYFNYQGDHCKLKMELKETELQHEKTGLIVQGIEIRPKEGNAFRCNTTMWLFNSEAESVREKFQSSDYLDILARSVSPIEYSTNSELLNHLCNSAILLDNGTTSFTLNEKSWKKCYMLGGRGLKISIGKSEILSWTSHPGSRFSEVAELQLVYWLSIRGEMETRMLSPRTTYVVYLVFQVADNSLGLSHPATTSISLVRAGGGVAEERTVYLKAQTPSHEPTRRPELFPQERTDGWMEIEIGEYYNDQGDHRKLEMELKETERKNKKAGLIVQGIELRPKEGL